MAERPNKDMQLFAAARAGIPDLVQEILDEGCPVDVRDPFGRTALHFAAEEGQVEVADILLRNGADPTTMSEHDEGAAPLHYAAGAGHLEVVELLLQDPRVSANSFSVAGMTPVHEAIEHGHTAVVRALLGHATSNPNQTDIFGVTLLVAAVFFRKIEIVNQLLELGADPNIANNGADDDAVIIYLAGIGPLHTAVYQGDVGIARTLLQHGANVNARDGDGNTPLALARGLTDHTHNDFAPVPEMLQLLSEYHATL
jgi:ankyrin repeat protein